MTTGATARVWNTLQSNRAGRLQRARDVLGSDLAGKSLPAARIADLLHAVLENGDRVCLEGNNQKQADFLGQALAKLNPERVNGLHMLQSVLALPEHLDVFERGVASKLDFSFSGPQATRVAKLAAAGKLNIGAIHTYLELFGRYFVDLPPRVALVAAEAADRHGNLYTGPNTEDTPVIAEATAFKNGIVTVVLPQEAIDRLMEVAVSEPVHIDLEAQTVTTPFQDRFTFEIDAFRKHCLLNGLDEVGLTMARGDAISAYEAKASAERPYLVHPA